MLPAAPPTTRDSTDDTSEQCHQLLSSPIKSGQPDRWPAGYHTFLSTICPRTMCIPTSASSHRISLSASAYRQWHRPDCHKVVVPVWLCDTTMWNTKRKIKSCCFNLIIKDICSVLVNNFVKLEECNPKTFLPIQLNNCMVDMSCNKTMLSQFCAVLQSTAWSSNSTSHTRILFLIRAQWFYCQLIDLILCASNGGMSGYFRARQQKFYVFNTKILYVTWLL